MTARAALPSLLLVAHGSRDPAGAAAIERVAARVARALPRARVEACFADVRGPTPADVLAELPGPCVAVPMFLAAGYHVRVDVPAQLRATGRADVAVAGALGPDPTLVAAAADRLARGGARSGDAVVLAAAGSSDPHARADGAQAARRLGRLIGRPVVLAAVGAVMSGARHRDSRSSRSSSAGSPRSGAGPDPAAAVAALRAAGVRRVAVASWLLAPGLFQRTLYECGADVVAEPLGEHPAVPAVVVARFRTALAVARRAA